MRKVTVTERNQDSFEWTDSYTEALLATFDELLHSRGLELVIGDGAGSCYPLRIDPVREDGEYDHENTHKVLFPYGRS